MGHFSVRELIVKNRHSNGSADHPALVFGDQSWSYRELDESVTQLASGLAAEGFVAGDRLAVYMYNRPEYVQLLFAVAHLGGIIVPLNYFLKGPEVQLAIEEAGITWLVVEDDLKKSLLPMRDYLDGRTRVVTVDFRDEGYIAIDDLMSAVHPLVAPAVLDQSDEFLYQFSSGTTGIPKAAVHTHGTVLTNALTQVAEFAITATDVHLVIPALCWGAGFHDFTIATWWSGGTVVLNPSRRFNALQLARSIEANGVTTVLLVPTVMGLLLHEPDINDAQLKSLRIILSGGEPVSVESLRELQSRLPECRTIQAYGLSEFPVITTFLDGTDALTHRGSAGKASLGTIIRVVDPDGNDVEPGSEGEIISKSIATMKGYTSPSVDAGTRLVDGWLYTGDRARVDEDGFIYIAGRAKDMIISGGLNIYPAEIERILVQQASVLESAVIGVKDEKYGETGLAVVVVDDPGHIEQPVLWSALRDQLSNFKVPRHWDIRTTPLPRTTSGKVQKFLLKQEMSNHLDHCTCIDQANQESK